MLNKKDFDVSKIDNIFEIVLGDIVNLGPERRVDAIVNAAKPTLMGGSGVDGAIHKKMNELLGKEAAAHKKNKSIRNHLGLSKAKHKTEPEELFNKQIKRAIDGKMAKADCAIRCDIGEAVITKGHEELAKYIIHAVGPVYDSGSECMGKLVKCYQNIMDLVFDTDDIYSVAIPVISSGNYGFPFDLALKIAITAIVNKLIEQKRKNSDGFSRLKKVYLVVYEERNMQIVQKIYQQYKAQIEAEKILVYMSVYEKQKAYLREIKINDTSVRGFFSITKAFRYLLVWSRFLFFSMVIQNYAGKKGWEFRKKVIEVETILKMLVPISCITSIQILQRFNPIWLETSVSWFLPCLNIITFYIMLDTITYLMSLIFLTDIYSASANPLRTIILLVFNYIEIVMGFSLFYYTIHWDEIKLWQAFDFGVLGKVIEGAMEPMERCICYAYEGVQFFFLVLTFTFFVSHLKQRKFRF